MAEYTETCKVFNRMCNSFDVCSECPMNKARISAYTCRHWMLCVDPEAAEKVIMKWNKENPVKTNRNIFQETFGFSLLDLFFSHEREIPRNIQKWLNEEYKEPEK